MSAETIILSLFRNSFNKFNNKGAGKLFSFLFLFHTDDDM